MSQLMVKYGLFEVNPETSNLRLLAMYKTSTEARSKIPKDKKFYSIIPIYSSYERTDFELGAGAEPVKTYK